MPQSRSTGERSLTASRAAETSPSVIRRMRPPASRTSLHRLLVARAVEHDDDDVADAAALALGDQLQGLGQGAVEVEQVGDLLAAGDLFHVDAGAGVEHRAALGEGDHREGAGHAEGAEPGPLERVDGDVDHGRAAVADLLAVVEHRRLVLLALADHDDAVHRDRVEDEAHRVDGGLVGGDLVAAPDPAGGGERRRLGDADELQREVAVGLGGRPLHRPGSLFEPPSGAPYVGIDGIKRTGTMRVEGRVCAHGTLGTDSAAAGDAARGARGAGEAGRGAPATPTSGAARRTGPTASRRWL